MHKNFDGIMLVRKEIARVTPIVVESVKKHPKSYISGTLIVGMIALAVFMGFPFGSKAAPLSDGLVAYWNMDDGTGVTANEVVNDYDGTLYGGSFNTLEFAYIPSNIGSAYFDGINDYIEVNDPGASSDFDVDKITLSAWIKIDGSMPSGTHNIIRKGHFGDRTFGLDITSGQLRGFVVIGGTAKIDTGVTVSADVWHHVAMTYDGSNVQVWLDGTADGTPAAATGDMYGNNLSVRIGGQPAGQNGGPLPFKGYIDEVRMYNRALTIDEVGALADYSEFTVELNEDLAVNTKVEESHNFTATLTPALSHIPVMFKVGGLHYDQDAVKMSDDAGEATLTLTNSGSVGKDSVYACVDGDISNSCYGDNYAHAKKLWVDLSATPPVDYNPVGTPHEVTADIGFAYAGLSIIMEVVSGPNKGAYDTYLTGDDGKAVLEYTGDYPGMDIIRVCIDLSTGVGTCDEGEIYTEVTKYWLEQYVTGGGVIKAIETLPVLRGKQTVYVTNEVPKFTFGGNVGHYEEGVLVGQFQVNDHSKNLSCHLNDFDDPMTFSGGATPADDYIASFMGSGWCNDGSTITAVVTITDNNEPGAGFDSIDFNGTLTDGLYSAIVFSKVITGGNFQVHNVMPEPPPVEPEFIEEPMLMMSAMSAPVVESAPTEETAPVEELAVEPVVTQEATEPVVEEPAVEEPATEPAEEPAPEPEVVVEDQPPVEQDLEVVVADTNGIVLEVVE